MPSSMWAGNPPAPAPLAVDAAVERERVVPVIERIAARLDVAISIDSSKPPVMAAAVAAGACIVNDVRALRAPGAREWAAAAGVGVCLMHMQGEPRTMQEHPEYHDVVAEVSAFLLRERAACLRGGHRARGDRARSRAWVSASGTSTIWRCSRIWRTSPPWVRRCWSACRARA